MRKYYKKSLVTSDFIIFRKVLLDLIKHKVFFLLTGIFIGLSMQAQVTLSQDTIPSKKNVEGLMLKPGDSITQDTLQVAPPKEALQDIITHTSDDEINTDFINNTTTLINNAVLTYEDVELKAGIIIIDFKNNLIKAFGIKDSTGYQQRPYFKQGNEESTQDSLIVNYDTERALVWGLQSEQQSDMIVRSKVSKKINDSTLYVRGISVTTSKKEKPDYDIRITKAKIIPNKKIIAQNALLHIADVPTIGYIPFAYFPLTRTRTSGILVPTWGESKQQGYFLQNGGYYLAISDYFDLALTGDIYTNGSWGIRAQSNYAWRYKFRGSLSYYYDNNVYSIRGFDDYSKSSQYNIRWSHSQDAAANPNARLSASVNLGSSKYYKESLNEYSNNSFLNNTLSSSISFSKRFNGTPFNMSLSATHSQNTNTQAITMSLPSLQLSMDRIYPFAPKNGSKKNALHKLGLNYNLAGNYQVTTNDDDFFTSRMFDGSKKGINHTTSLSTNMKVFKYFTLNPSANYKETWYFDYLQKNYDTDLGSVVTDTLSGFRALREYSTGVSMSTNVYGTFNFKKGRLKAIRHTVRPSVSYSYRPDFGFYDEAYYNPETNEYVDYSPYQGSLYGAPGKGISNSLGFTLNNVFEAKVRSKDSTETEDRKITLLNNLNLSSSYDMTRDSLRWSPVNMNAGTQLFNNKLRLNMNATLNPYAINAAGTTIDRFNIDNGGSLFRLTRAGLTMNYSLSNQTFAGKEDQNAQNNEARMNQNERNMLGGDLTDQGDNNSDKEAKKVKLYHNKMPWNLSLSYSVQYTNARREDEISTHSLMFNGDIELTPKWNIGFSSGYDFKRKGITYTQMNFQRDLDSWKMTFNWVPFGNRQTYYFFIGVKSAVLSDLKYDKRSLPDKRLF
jgi:lipopolysaccharide assembly outer membrane protein LptD (OstA)